MKYRMQTLADDNITSDLPMYLDDDGEFVDPTVAIGDAAAAAAVKALRDGADPADKV